MMRSEKCKNVQIDKGDGVADHPEGDGLVDQRNADAEYRLD